MGDLRRQQQTFVNDGARGERRDVKKTLVGQAGGGHLVLGAFADHVELAFQLLFGHPPGPPHEDLLDIGLRGARHAANGRGIDGGVAPTEHGETLFTDDALQDAFALQADVRLHGKEGHAHAVLSRRRQRETELSALAGEELVGDLNQDAGAIAGAGIAAAGAPVRQVDQNLNAFQNDVVRLLALEVRNEADSAGIVLLARVVQALRWG